MGGVPAEIEFGGYEIWWQQF